MGKKESNILRVLGLVGIVLAIALNCVPDDMPVFILCILAVVALEDIWLIYSGYHSISEWVHSWMDYKADFVVLCVVAGVMWWFGDNQTMVDVSIGTTLGHLLWQSQSRCNHNLTVQDK